MADVKIELTSRQKQRQERMKKLAENSAPKMVKVWPANEDTRRMMRHPGGARFRNDLNTPVEWPLDGFTKRRIRDGDVSLDGAVAQKSAAKTEGLNAREISYARRPKPKNEADKSADKSAPQTKPAA